MTMPTDALNRQCHICHRPLPITPRWKTFANVGPETYARVCEDLNDCMRAAGDETYQPIPRPAAPTEKPAWKKQQPDNQAKMF